MRSVCIALLAFTAAAQESIHFASVGGRVTDPSGAVVMGAQIRVRQVETNANYEALTDREGLFRFAYLRIGEWEITVHGEGFAESKRTLAVTAGGAYDLPFTLALASGGTTVTV